MTRLPNSISINWHYEDIKSHDVEMLENEQLTDREYREIIQNVKRNHDCNIGITWDVITSEIASYRAEKELTPQCDVCGKKLYKNNGEWVCEDDDLHNEEN